MARRHHTGEKARFWSCADFFFEPAPVRAFPKPTGRSISFSPTTAVSEPRHPLKWARLHSTTWRPGLASSALTSGPPFSPSLIHFSLLLWRSASATLATRASRAGSRTKSRSLSSSGSGSRHSSHAGAVAARRGAPKRVRRRSRVRPRDQAGRSWTGALTAASSCCRTQSPTAQGRRLPLARRPGAEWAFAGRLSRRRLSSQL